MAKSQVVIIPQGGMNTEDNGFDIPKERMLLGNNYELAPNGRPRRVDGFERFDGRPSPSAFQPTTWVDEDDYRTQLFAGIAARRAVITAVPGSGVVRGIVMFLGIVYAWRNNAGGTLLDCYQNTSGGWSKVVALSAKTVMAGTSKVRTDIANFQAGGARGTRLYIVDGTSYAQEWDGTTATNIGTGLTGFPFLVAAHKNHLFLGFASGSVVNSNTGDPAGYGGTGSAEISMPDDLTNLQSLPGGVLAITCLRIIELLTGSDTTDWVKTTHSTTSGAVLDSMQVLGDALLLDGGDITWLKRTQDFGNFKGTPISRDISSIVSDAMTTCAGSLVLRNKAQFRLFMTDGRTICGTFAGSRVLGWTMMDLGVTPNVVAVAKDNDSAERSFIGCDDGFVYEMDIGRSFDGENIVAIMRMAFASCGSPGLTKRFHDISIEGTAGEDTIITMQPDFTYSDEDESPVAESHEITIQGRGNFWDVGDWDDFLWGRPIAFRQRTQISGTGHNISVLFASDSAQDLSHTILAMTITFTPRGRRA
jgi:hypothetical protein